MRHVICACLALLVASLAWSAEPPQQPIAAVWRPQRVTFHYRSEGKLYGCDLLEHKIGNILAQLGARDQIIVRGIRCRDFATTVQVEVIMELPVVATEENMREITQYTSEDELIARVRGTTLPTAEELERFPAVWESIALHRAPKVYLEKNDCALVQQLRRQVLPKMSVQIVKDIDRVDCSQASPRLTVVALVAAL
jgi:hypothetical protein